MTTPRDVLAELGVRPVINASGFYTFIGGAVMAPEVVEAWAQAARTQVRLEEVYAAANRRVAELLGVEAALITAGAAASLTLAAAACITGGDPDRILRLPDTSGMADEVVVQHAHRFSYDHAIRAAGLRMVEVDSVAEAEAAITDRTALLLFLNLATSRGDIPPREWTTLAHRHGKPTVIDCAADVPPLDTITRALDNGFDLVAVSGGKAIGGPQNAGLLVGRPDLIAAARANAAPNADVLARGMKVNKETLVAMVVALERFVARDHAAEWREWEARVEAVAAALRDVPGVRTERFVPPIASHAPHLAVRWSPDVIPLTLAQAVAALRDGEPSIEVVPSGLPPEAVWSAIGPLDALNVAVWTLQPHEVAVVARRLVEVLGGAARR